MAKLPVVVFPDAQVVWRRVQSQQQQQHTGAALLPLMLPRMALPSAAALAAAAGAPSRAPLHVPEAEGAQRGAGRLAWPGAALQTQQLRPAECLAMQTLHGHTFLCSLPPIAPLHPQPRAAHAGPATAVPAAAAAQHLLPGFEAAASHTAQQQQPEAAGAPHIGGPAALAARAAAAVPAGIPAAALAAVPPCPESAAAAATAAAPTGAHNSAAARSCCQLGQQLLALACAPDGRARAAGLTPVLARRYQGAVSFGLQSEGQLGEAAAWVWPLLEQGEFEAAAVYLEMLLRLWGC